MTQAEASQAVAILRAAFPGLRFPPESAALYEKMLADLDFELVKAAVHRLVAVQTQAFIPTIGAIRTEAARQAHGALRSGEEAWGDVLAEIRRTGAYGRPRLKDGVAAKCVELMGWRDLCLSTNDVADRARFCTLYVDLRDRERAGQVASPALRLLPPLDPKLLGIG